MALHLTKLVSGTNVFFVFFVFFFLIINSVFVSLSFYGGPIADFRCSSTESPSPYLFFLVLDVFTFESCFVWFFVLFFFLEQKDRIGKGGRRKGAGFNNYLSAVRRRHLLQTIEVCYFYA